MFALVQAFTAISVVTYSRQAAIQNIEGDLVTGRNLFAELTRQHMRQMLLGAELLSGDFAFKQAFFDAAEDRETLLSALVNHRDRIGADEILLADLDAVPIAGTWEEWDDEALESLAQIVDAAVTSNAFRADAFILVRDELYALVVVPLLAPAPVAWICIGFSITDAFAEEFKETARMDISFVRYPESGPLQVFASTLPDAERADLGMGTEAAIGPSPNSGENTHLLKMNAQPFIASWLPLAAESAGQTGILLQRSLREELAPYRRLHWVLLGIALVGLLVTGAAAAKLASSVSRPVYHLVAGTRRVEKGDYTTRVDIDQEDEMGELALSFNRMTEGMAERDRVRETLGKVVSPEIARELMDRGIELGGEEREVTVLFADIRGFTTLSERLPAAEIVSALNIYLTHMSRIIEDEGGVVDKFIGDEIMALFGAPVRHDDDPDRALRAARRMIAEVDRLGDEFRARRLPTLQIGIGLNTAIVTAGNMGSASRLNYTVIGDGVNLASRLQSLTRETRFNARIIAGEETVKKARQKIAARSLGEVRVKGKEQPVRVFGIG